MFCCIYTLSCCIYTILCYVYTPFCHIYTMFSSVYTMFSHIYAVSCCVYTSLCPHLHPILLSLHHSLLFYTPFRSIYTLLFCAYFPLHLHACLCQHPSLHVYTPFCLFLNPAVMEQLRSRGGWMEAGRSSRDSAPSPVCLHHKSPCLSLFSPDNGSLRGAV